MARNASGRRFFTVKVWNEWTPVVHGCRYIEAFLMLVTADSVNEAMRVAWTEELESDGLETSYQEIPVTTHGLGVDHVYDTGRAALGDFEEDPLLYSQLFAVGTDGISYFEPSRLSRPPTVPGEWEVDHSLPEYQPVHGSVERWFSVKLWRTWAVGKDTRFFEEVVVAVRARSDEEAGQRGCELAIAADTDVVNEAGEVFHVRTVNLDYVHDHESRTLIDQMGTIVFGQVYDLDEYGSVGYFDRDNDLPFRKGALN